MSGNGSMFDRLASTPIPTYEEAISRPTSSQLALGPTQPSHDAERQRLHHGSSSGGGYRAPFVASARDSMESGGSDLSVPDMVDNERTDERNLEELDYLEPGESETMDRRHMRQYHRARIRSKFVQQLSNISATIGALRVPRFRRRYAPVPNSSGEPQPRRSWRSRFAGSLHIPEQYRISLPTFARLCALLTIGAFVWFLFSIKIFSRRQNMMATMFEPESVRIFVLENVDGYRIRDNLEHISSFAHEAGTEGSYFMARWMQDTWRTTCELDDTAIMTYNILANYPVTGKRSVKVTQPEGARWTADIEEYYQRADREQTLAWHTHSPNGVAQGPLIYANAGSREDFQYLQERNVVTNGTIALVHLDAEHTPQSTALKVRFAEEAGCIGILVFNGDSLTNPDIQSTWPGSALPGNDSIHRANVVLSNWILGDPLTPGYPSKKDARPDHKAAAVALSSIPSLPLSWQDASSLLSTLQGQGIKTPNDWLIPNSYTGSGASTSEDAIIVELQNENEITESQQIFNVHAEVQGAEAPRMKVIVGAPRDSWCFGATHSASASAILTEMVSIFGSLRKQGWRPLRSIEFVSWDASTFNFAGSTEYVEDHIDELRSGAIAYVNIGAGVSGPDLKASGSPALQRILQHALKRVNIPGGNQTMKEAFDPDEGSSITPLRRNGVINDCSPFTDMAGVPSLSMQFSGKEGDWVQGSCYDTFQWLQSYADNVSDELEYHKSLALVWTLVVLDLVSAPLLPLDARIYADSIADDATAMETDVQDFVTAQTSGQGLNEVGIDFTPLHDAAASLKQAALLFHTYEAEWTNSVLSEGGMEDLYQNRVRHEWNAVLNVLEKAFISMEPHGGNGNKGGLKDRPQYRHILSAPEKWKEGLQIFPSVWEYLEEHQWQQAGDEISRLAAIITEAGNALVV